MRKVEINNIKEVLKKVPDNINLMLLGDTGIGKTSVVREFAKENDVYIQTLFLSTIQASESLGIPYKDDEVMKMAIPEWVINFENANKENKKCILFLDEFLCSLPETQNAFLNFMCKKDVGSHDLTYVRIILASNIGNYTFNLDKNMLNRICFINCVNSANFLKEYIKNVDERFLLKLDTMEYESRFSDNNIFEKRKLSPRQIEELSNIKDEDIKLLVYQGYTNEDNIPNIIK